MDCAVVPRSEVETEGERIVKILGISCSPRASGNTVVLMEEALAGAREEGAEVELFSLAGKDIRPCDACGACHSKGRCHIEDDMQAVYDRMAEADGIIFGTPIYFYGMTAQLKALIDRTFAPLGDGKRMANKVGGIITVAGSVGIIDAVKDLYFYFATQRMLPGNWVGAYASGKGDVKGKTQAMKAAREMGREMVQIAAKRFEFPRGFGRNHFAYGTHTH